MYKVSPDSKFFLCAGESDTLSSDGSNFTPCLLTVAPWRERDMGNIVGVIAVFKLQI